MDLDCLLTQEDYILILQEKLNTSSFKFLEAKWSPLSDKVEGYLGEYYILTLYYTMNNNNHEITFFIKTKPRSNLSQLKVEEKLNMFYKESLVYMKLFKNYENKGYKINFAPKCYLSKNNETLVFEDMRKQNFSLVGQRFLDMEECKAALRALAIFHANSLAFEESRSLELGRIFRLNEDNPEVLKEIFYSSSKKELDLDYDESTINCMIELSKLISETPEWKQKFSTKLKNFDTYKVFATELHYRKTCCHGDLWVNNMLFRKQNDSQIDCVLIDFQAIRHHHPSLDALFVLYLTTSRSFRQKYKDVLLDFHYKEMAFVLDSYGFNLNNILPKDDYLKSSHAFESIAAFQGAGNRSVTLLSPEITANIIKSSGNDFKDLLFSNLRSKIAVKAFQSDENYRKILTEDIYDLFDIL